MKTSRLALTALAFVAWASLAFAQTQPLPSAVRANGQAADTTGVGVVVAPAGGGPGRGRVIAEDSGFPIQGLDTVTNLPCAIGFTSTCSLPGTGGGGGGGSLLPWNATGTPLNLSATTTSSNGAFSTTDTTLFLQNLGSATAYYKFGGAAVTAATTDYPILPGQSLILSTAGQPRIAVITAAGTASLTATTGTGTPSAGLALNNGTEVPVGGAVAEGGTPTNPVYVGCRASTTNPTTQADGKAVAFKCGPSGKLAVDPFNVRNQMTQSALITLTGTTETTLLAAGGASVFNDMVSFKVCNTNASTDVRIDLRDVTAGTVIDSWQVKAGYCTGEVFSSPLKQTTANSSWTVQASASVTDTRIKAQFAITGP